MSPHVSGNSNGKKYIFLETFSTLPERHSSKIRRIKYFRKCTIWLKLYRFLFANFISPNASLFVYPTPAPLIPNGARKVDRENLPICTSLSCIGLRLRLWWPQVCCGFLQPNPPQSGQSLSSYWSLYPPPRALTGINFISYKKETGSVTGGRRLIILSRMRWQVLCWHQTRYTH